MEIAICCDTDVTNTHIEQLLITNVTTKQLQCFCYTSYDQLLIEMEEKNRIFDGVIFTVKDRVQHFLHWVRNHNPNIVLLGLIHDAKMINQLIIQGVKYFAHCPINETVILKLLERVSEDIKSKYITYKGRFTTYHIVKENIVYVKSLRNRSILFIKRISNSHKYIQDGRNDVLEETIINMTMHSQIELLGRDFFQVHRSILVNMMYIEQVDKNKHILRLALDNIELPFSKERTSCLEQELLLRSSQYIKYTTLQQR